MTILMDKLTELGFVIEDNAPSGTLLQANGGDGQSNISVWLDNYGGNIQVIQQPHDPENKTVVVNWNHSCPALLDLLTVWTQ